MDADDCTEAVPEAIEPCKHTWADFRDPLALCGCGKRHIRTYRDEDTYHFEGRHWSSYCLISELARRLGIQPKTRQQ